MNEEDQTHENATDDESYGLDDEALPSFIASKDLEGLQRLELGLKILALLRESREGATSVKSEHLKEDLAQARTAFLESAKLRMEVFKTQNLLSSGALVAFTVITAGLVSAGLISEPGRVAMLVFAYIAVVVSITCTFTVMFSLSADLATALSPTVGETKPTIEGRRTDKTAHFLSSFGFVLGLVLFLEFIRYNLLGF